MSHFEKIYEVYGLANTLFDEENVLDYRPGGYHPVALGDTLKNGRYKIYHKLGYGGFSTVWVARDSKLERWVAVKILVADMMQKSRELDTLRALSEHSKRDLGPKHIVRLLDDFLHEGRNGCHQCLVFELLGPTVEWYVRHYLREEEALEAEEILDLSTQLLQAVAFLHEAGYVHGDLSARNLAFASSRLPHHLEDELVQVLGAPEAKDLTRLDGAALGEGVPKQLVRSVQWLGWPADDDDDDDEVRLIDLGEAFRQDAAPKRLAQPGDLQAPETIFTGRFDYRVDLWRAGLIIHFLMFKTYPFIYWDIEMLVGGMIDFAGDLPAQWLPKWEQIKLEAGEEAERGQNGQRSRSELEERFDKHVHDPELKVLLPVIRGLTRLLPSDRISAAQALDLIRDDSANRHEDIDESTPASDGDS